MFVPIFGGDEFVEMVLNGKWFKRTDTVLLDFKALTNNGSLEITGRAAVSGNADYGWIQSTSQIYLKKDVVIDVHLKLPGHSTSQTFWNQFFITPQTNTVVTPPSSNNDYLVLSLMTNTTTYKIYVTKKINGSSTTLVNGVTVVNQEGTYRVKFTRFSNRVHIYFHDGSGDVDEGSDEVANSPFDLDLAFDSAFCSYMLQNIEAVARTVSSDFVRVTYPSRNDIKYELPIKKQGIETLFIEAENASLGSGVDTVNLDDDSGTSARLNAQNEQVYYPFNAGTNLSAGRYIALIRIKDTDQVANDVSLRAYNNPDNEYRNLSLGELYLTLSLEFRVYSIIFDVTEEDVSGTDQIYLRVFKNLATANTVYVDWFRIIPYSELNGGCKVWDTKGEASESNWQRVFDLDHLFNEEDEFWIENGLIRFGIERTWDNFELYFWDGVSWVLATGLQACVAGWCQDRSLKLIKFLKISSEEVKMLISSWSSSPDNIMNKSILEISLKRGSFCVVCFNKKNYVNPFRFNWPGMRFGVMADDDLVSDSSLSTTNTGGKTANNYQIMLKEGWTKPFLLLAGGIGGQAYWFNGESNGWSSFPEGEGESMFMGAIPFSRIGDLFKEAENCSLQAGADTEDLGDDSGTSARLNAQYELVAWQKYPNDLPKGRYLAFFRIKDTNQVAWDCGIRVYNATDSRFLNEENAEVIMISGLTANWHNYALVFDITDADLNDNIYLSAIKLTTNTNTIYVDYFLVVPIGNGNNWPQDIAYNMMRKIVSERKLLDR